MTDVPNDGEGVPASDAGTPDPGNESIGSEDSLTSQGRGPDAETIPDDLSSLHDTPPAEGLGGAVPNAELSVEDLVHSLESVSTERDQYLDALRRVQAEFENYKKAIAKRSADERERANDKIVADLLPVLDACEGAVANGSEQIVPVHNQLVAALERHGLERSIPEEAPFNPEEHEAVMHEPSDDVSEPTVAEVLRTGYLWKGRVLRPAMVRVKG